MISDTLKLFVQLSRLLYHVLANHLADFDSTTTLD